MAQNTIIQKKIPLFQQMTTSLTIFYKYKRKQAIANPVHYRFPAFVECRSINLYSTKFSLNPLSRRFSEPSQHFICIISKALVTDHLALLSLTFYNYSCQTLLILNIYILAGIQPKTTERIDSIESICNSAPYYIHTTIWPIY